MHLLFTGDSLIEYFDWQERFQDHSVMNLGIAGESVEGLLSRINRISDVCPKADMIFIMSGINNVAMGDIEFIDAYRKVIEKFADFYPEARIYVTSLLATRLDFIDDDSIRKLNVSLKELATQKGATYFDIYSLFVDAEGRAVRDYLLADGIHISDQGYAVWSDALEKAIHL